MIKPLVYSSEDNGYFRLQTKNGPLIMNLEGRSIIDAINKGANLSDLIELLSGNNNEQIISAKKNLYAFLSGLAFNNRPVLKP